MVGVTSSKESQLKNWPISWSMISSAFFGLLGALCQVRLPRPLQVVHVVEIDVGDIVHLGVDVAGHGDVDEKHRLLLARR